MDEEEYLDKINSDPKRVIEPKNGEKKEDDGLLNYKGIHFNDKPGYGYSRKPGWIPVRVGTEKFPMESFRKVSGKFPPSGKVSGK